MRVSWVTRTWRYISSRSWNQQVCVLLLLLICETGRKREKKNNETRMREKYQRLWRREKREEGRDFMIIESRERQNNGYIATTHVTKLSLLLELIAWCLTVQWNMIDMTQDVSPNSLWSIIRKHSRGREEKGREEKKIYRKVAVPVVKDTRVWSCFPLRLMILSNVIFTEEKYEVIHNLYIVSL